MQKIASLNFCTPDLKCKKPAGNRNNKMINSGSDAVLQNALHGQKLSPDEIRHLLGLREGKAVSRLFRTARQIRGRHFGNKVFLYGFLYFSTFCRNNCRFCQFRKANFSLERYRKTDSEIIEAARRMADAGVHLIDLTMGEDPDFLQMNSNGSVRLENLVHKIKTETGLPIMVSPGVISSDMLKRLAEAGADWYACYQETHHRPLFERLRIGQSYDERWQAKKYAQNAGLLIEEGILTGVGETADDILHSLEMMRSLKADQVRIMSFRPQNGIPMSDDLKADDLSEPVTIAVMRLIFPGAMIPASSDVDGPDGLRQRLRAGANVITSLIPPGKGFTGVVTADTDSAQRMPRSIAPVLEHCALEAASAKDYMRWIETRRSQSEFHQKLQDSVC